MNEQEIKSLNGSDARAEESLGSFIARLAIKTLVCFFIIFSLAAAVLSCLFPKAYMNFYRSIGLYGKASMYATVASMMAEDSHFGDCNGSCEYSSLLVVGIDCSVLAGDYERLYELTDKYLNSPCHEKRSAIVDAKYLEGMGNNYVALSVIYGYDDYVHGERIRAMLESGGEYASEAESDVNEALANPTTATLDMLIAYTDFGADGLDEERVKTVYQAYAEGAKNVGVTSDGKPDEKKIALKSSLLHRVSALAENLCSSGVISQSEAEETQTAYEDFIKSLN